MKANYLVCLLLAALVGLGNVACSSGSSSNPTESSAVSESAQDTSSCGTGNASAAADAEALGLCD